ncbi:MAG: hypothetical protein Q4B86_01725 [Eubacteriales bacterium]|nr:hypothetical protein [Eubacteriales bacterium]
MFKKYIEVYTTLSMEKFFIAKNILANNSIPYKDTSTNNQLRLSSNNLRGNNYLFSRDSAVKTVYSLPVRKDDEARARFLLNKI